nr:lysyl oxidase homolog 3B-like [Salvelinus alpinus]
MKTSRWWQRFSIISFLLGVWLPAWIMAQTTPPTQGSTSPKPQNDPLQFRLVGYPRKHNEGRIEVFYKGEWGTICDDDFSLSNANVLCRQLGFVSATGWTHSAKYGKGLGKIWLDNVQCNGGEKSIDLCKSRGWGNSDCTHDEDAGVVCKDERLPGFVDSNVIDVQVDEDRVEEVRLRSVVPTKKMPVTEGVVEIKYKNGWAQICDVGWTPKNTRVICGMLGFPHEKKINKNFYKARLRKRAAERKARAKVNVSAGARLHPKAIAKPFTSGLKKRSTVRLKGGAKLGEGRVEVLRNNEWGTVCDDRWTLLSASVVCRELGFGSAKEALTGARMGEGMGPIHMNEVQCLGTEKSMWDCGFKNITSEDCQHVEDAAVSGNTRIHALEKLDHTSPISALILVHTRPPLPNRSAQPQIRLTGGRTRYEGRVEVLSTEANGTRSWGLICGGTWGTKEAMVACRQLGLGYANNGLQTSSITPNHPGLITPQTLVSYPPLSYAPPITLSSSTPNTPGLQYPQHPGPHYPPNTLVSSTPHRSSTLPPHNPGLQLPPNSLGPPYLPMTDTWCHNRLTPSKYTAGPPSPQHPRSRPVPPTPWSYHYPPHPGFTLIPPTPGHSSVPPQHPWSSIHLKPNTLSSFNTNSTPVRPSYEPSNYHGALHLPDPTARGRFSVTTAISTPVPAPLRPGSSVPLDANLSPAPISEHPWCALTVTHHKRNAVPSISPNAPPFVRRLQYLPYTNTLFLLILAPLKLLALASVHSTAPHLPMVVLPSTPNTPGPSITDPDTLVPDTTLPHYHYPAPPYPPLVLHTPTPCPFPPTRKSSITPNTLSSMSPKYTLSFHVPPNTPGPPLPPTPWSLHYPQHPSVLRFSPNTLVLQYPPTLLVLPLPPNTLVPHYPQHPWPPVTPKHPSVLPTPNTTWSLPVRIVGGRTYYEGRVEVQVGARWGTVCSAGWTTKEAMVVCRQLGLGYSMHAITVSMTGMTDFTGMTDMPDMPDMTGMTGMIDLTGMTDITGMTGMPDMTGMTDMKDITGMTGVTGMTDMTGMIVLNNSSLLLHSPCRHYHSMDIFTHYDLLSSNGTKVAEGHKASFCLEDTACHEGISKRYECANFGEQGITVGCWDLYRHDIDCQWIDITDIKPGNYILQIVINPNFEVAESDFTNNAMKCNCKYDGHRIWLHNCHMGDAFSEEAERKFEKYPGQLNNQIS